MGGKEGESVSAFYFVIRGSEDGDASISAHTAEDLNKKLAEGYWGEAGPKWATALPGFDIREFSPYGVIIKGEIVVPKAVDVVKSWEVP